MEASIVEKELQDIREQLDVQADAISRLAGIVSDLDGVDAALLGSYVMRLKRLHGPTIEAPPSGAAPGGPSAAEGDPSQATTQ